ncbi:MAG: hypothetical protein K9H61_11035 [Bacteroidia bacterium]|nr:hypothetical protein [Bacteroidia bacterium]MCF8447520.1 hypothetical protein [Bacteroidia bacterium]
MKTHKILLILSLAFISLQGLAQKNEKQKDTCGTFYKIDEGNIEVSEKKKSTQLDFTYSLTANSDKTSSIEVLVTIKDCKGTEKQIPTTLKFDPKTNKWTSSLTIENNKDCPWQLVSFNLSLENNCGEKFSTDPMSFSELKDKKNVSHSNHRTKKRFNPNLQTKGSGNGNSNNENAKDSCDFNNFTIEDGSITVNDVKSAMGIYVTLSLSEKKGMASRVVMLIEIENCKGEKQYVKLELTYDSKTGMWVGKQVIPQNPECAWKINSYKYLIYNACDDEYETDVIDYSTVKSTTSLTKRARRVKIHK